jgi:hypothetical protein
MPDWADRAAVADYAAAGAENLGNGPAARATAERIWDRTPSTEPTVQMANHMGMQAGGASDGSIGSAVAERRRIPGAAADECDSSHVVGGLGERPEGARGNRSTSSGKFGLHNVRRSLEVRERSRHCAALRALRERRQRELRERSSCPWRQLNQSTTVATT